MKLSVLHWRMEPAEHWRWNVAQSVVYCVAALKCFLCHWLISRFTWHHNQTASGRTTSLQLWGITFFRTTNNLKHYREDIVNHVAVEWSECFPVQLYWWMRSPSSLARLHIAAVQNCYSHAQYTPFCWHTLSQEQNCIEVKLYLEITWLPHCLCHSGCTRPCFQYF